jgi:hypothetical protein
METKDRDRTYQNSSLNIQQALYILQIYINIFNHTQHDAFLGAFTKSFVMSVRLSFHPHGKTWLPLDGFS